MFSKALVLAALLPYAFGAATYTVTVGIDETDGKAGLGFDPTSIRPSAGDTIRFEFALPSYIKDPKTMQHTATQSTFESPCSPMSGGFDTGVRSTGSVNSNTGEHFEVTVNSTEPLWFFSSANKDCGAGMVLTVNPPLTGDQTAAAFKAKAQAAGGGSTETEEDSTTASGSSTTAAGSGTGTGTPSSGASKSTSAGSSSTSGNPSASSPAPTGAAARTLAAPILAVGAVAIGFFGAAL